MEDMANVSITPFILLLVDVVAYARIDCIGCVRTVGRGYLQERYGRNQKVAFPRIHYETRRQTIAAHLFVLTRYPFNGHHL